VQSHFPRSADANEFDDQDLILGQSESAVDREQDQAAAAAGAADFV
jgi:hypothetical protein